MGRKCCLGTSRCLDNVNVFWTMLAKRKIRLKKLAQEIGITEQNLSILKTGKARAIRFSTLQAICRYLDCQPGDILEYHKSEGKN